MYVSLYRLPVPEHGAPDVIVAFRARAHLVEDIDGVVDLRSGNPTATLVRPYW